MSSQPPKDQKTRPSPRRPQRAPLEPTRRHQQIRSPQDNKTTRKQTDLSVPWWVFALTILIVAGLTCGLWAYVLANQGDSATALGPTPTPIFVVITATPTLEGAAPPVTSAPGTPASTADAPSEPTAILTPEATATFAGIPLSVGAQVIVTGTEGAGLAIRQGPGTDYTYFFVADDGDSFIIEDGPREGEGYTWWLIADPEDENRSGWAAGLFLRVTE